MGYTNSSNDQVVGCLPDHIQSEGDLENLINLNVNNLTNSNQHQYNQIQYIVNSNQLNPNQLNSSRLSPNQLNANQLNTNRLSPNQLNVNRLSPNQLNVNQISSNQLTANRLSPNPLNSNQINTNLIGSNQLVNNLVDSNQFPINQPTISTGQFVQASSQSNNQAFINNSATSYNYDNSNFDKDFQLNQFEIDDEELEFNHLKELEDLMETTQVNQPTRSSSSQQQLLVNTNQPNQQFLTTTTHPIHPTSFDNRSTNYNINNSSSSAQCNQRCSTVNIQVNSAENDNFLNSTQLSSNNGLNTTCNNNFLANKTNFSQLPTNISTATSTSNESLSAAAFCDRQLVNNLSSNLNSNLNNNLNSSNLNHPLNLNQTDLFCQQPSTSANMIKSDSSTLLSANQWNQNQFNQLNNQMMNFNSNPTASFPPTSPSNQTQTINQQSSQKSLANAKNQQLQHRLSNIKSPSSDWLNSVTNQVLKDMNRCGICVIDNFLGSAFCNTCLNEVVNLYGDGYFKDGLLVGNKSNGDKNIRGDKILWVEGKEPNCLNIGYLMRTLDQILMRFSQLNTTDGCRILNRTKAMIACYPGEGTKYVKHVDNPNQDGRYITCIYYLNKSWNSKIDGGSLRIFPKDLPYVANIEPLFDRVIFFWSDRRNPHEVMPSYSIRFAITLWYFNQEERQQFINRQSLQS